MAHRGLREGIGLHDRPFNKALSPTRRDRQPAAPGLLRAAVGFAAHEAVQRAAALTLGRLDTREASVEW
jgi:hypothetical protein